MKNTGKPIPVGIPTTPESKYRLRDIRPERDLRYKQEDIVALLTLGGPFKCAHVLFKGGKFYCSAKGKDQRL